MTTHFESGPIGALHLFTDGSFVHPRSGASPSPQPVAAAAIAVLAEVGAGEFRFVGACSLRLSSSL
eukprot:14425711-Alexandrium_andersonii.AAC.1